jgi:hypothetical protein
VHLLVEIHRGPTADYITPKIKENGQELSEIHLFVRVLGLSGMVGDDSNSHICPAHVGSGSDVPNFKRLL